MHCLYSFNCCGPLNRTKSKAAKLYAELHSIILFWSAYTCIWHHSLYLSEKLQSAWVKGLSRGSIWFVLVTIADFWFVHWMSFPCYILYREVSMFLFSFLHFQGHQHFVTIHNDRCIYTVNWHGQFIFDGIRWLCKVGIDSFEIYVVSKYFFYNKMSSHLHFGSSLWFNFTNVKKGNKGYSYIYCL